MSVSQSMPQCLLCEYLVGGMDPDNERGKPVCRAFPEGIPDQIWFGGFDHREQLGSEGVLFKLKEGKTEDDLVEWEASQAEPAKEAMLSLVDQLETEGG